MHEMTDENQLQTVKRVWITDLLVISVKKIKVALLSSQSFQNVLIDITL